jgi:CMP-N-acetylneuraminic acid synthetase
MPGRSEVLALIPARGGSKGIPRKNVALLGGQPLIAYTIRAALACQRITRVVVSTDDDEIAAVARAFGAEVPFFRPQNLAEDRSEIGACIDHALGLLTAQGYEVDHVVELYPTSPFRTAAFLEKMIAPLLEGYQNSVVARPVLLSERLYAPAAGGGVTHMSFGTPEEAYFLRRYGLFFGHAIRTALRGTFVHVLDDPILAVDIDTPEDLVLAETIIANNLFDFGLP